MGVNVTTGKPDASAARLEALRSKVDKARKGAAHWRARADELTVALDAKRARMLALERERRRSPRAEVLGHVLRQRAAGRPPLLAGDEVLAAQREARFCQVAEGYVSALAAAAPTGEAAQHALIQRVEIQGIPWWVPRDEGTRGRSVRLVEQGFPLRTLLQTRQFAMGGIMLDLGGNIGRTSVTRVLLGDVRAVYAAEPEPANYAALVQNVLEHGLRGFVLPHNVAIGATRDQVRLGRAKYIGGHRVKADAAARPSKLGDVPTALWPLDAWIDHVGVEREAITFVKVDIQGFELYLLRGAAGLLARRDIAWQIEVDPALLTTAGSSLGDLLTCLESHFTHAIDMSALEPAPAVRTTSSLRDLLTRLGGGAHKTDLLLYNTSDR
jgi:FkbM family methyltransferase